jgi:hypothetical protein
MIKLSFHKTINGLFQYPINGFRDFVETLYVGVLLICIALFQFFLVSLILNFKECFGKLVYYILKCILFYLHNCVL